MSRGDTLIATVQLIIETCCACGTPFGIETSLRNRLLEKRPLPFYCPNGHGQHYLGEPESARLQRELGIAQECANAEAEGRVKAERMLDAHLKSARRRAVAGLCPYCHRHFLGLERHVAKKHSDKAG